MPLRAYGEDVAVEGAQEGPPNPPGGPSYGGSRSVAQRAAGEKLRLLQQRQGPQHRQQLQQGEKQLLQREQEVTASVQRTPAVEKHQRRKHQRSPQDVSAEEGEDAAASTGCAAAAPPAAKCEKKPCLTLWGDVADGPPDLRGFKQKFEALKAKSAKTREKTAAEEAAATATAAVEEDQRLAASKKRRKGAAAVADADPYQQQAMEAKGRVCGYSNACVTAAAVKGEEGLLKAPNPRVVSHASGASSALLAAASFPPLSPLYSRRFSTERLSVVS
ncbi:hypothetical protein cyc_06830 [Cyclospora cayetanensis]|uniref:Uncharacterized protein n=1 Tax=Cyclospora cayetanensis TaxID=88456 RepID=A0A1D3D0M7_9EIME|nr:hypothetical protein cyc_06830 [Cyclospora cayetanensis]